jgi:hypothetical protein
VGDEIKKNEMEGVREHVACVGREELHIGFLMEEAEGETPLGRPRRRWEDSVKMDLQGLG